MYLRLGFFKLTYIACPKTGTEKKLLSKQHHKRIQLQIFPYLFDACTYSTFNIITVRTAAL